VAPGCHRLRHRVPRNPQDRPVLGNLRHIRAAHRIAGHHIALVDRIAPQRGHRRPPAIGSGPVKGEVVHRERVARTVIDDRRDDQPPAIVVHRLIAHDRAIVRGLLGPRRQAQRDDPVAAIGLAAAPVPRAAIIATAATARIPGTGLVLECKRLPVATSGQQHRQHRRSGRISHHGTCSRSTCPGLAARRLVDNLASP